MQANNEAQRKAHDDWSRAADWYSYASCSQNDVAEDAFGSGYKAALNSPEVRALVEAAKILQPILVKEELPHTVGMRGGSDDGTDDYEAGVNIDLASLFGMTTEQYAKLLADLAPFQTETAKEPS